MRFIEIKLEGKARVIRKRVIGGTNLYIFKKKEINKKYLKRPRRQLPTLAAKRIYSDQSIIYFVIQSRQTSGNWGRCCSRPTSTARSCCGTCGRRED